MSSNALQKKKKETAMGQKTQMRLYKRYSKRKKEKKKRMLIEEQKQKH